jgi:hypothetical protein
VNRTWSLTALEFVSLWEETGEGILPEPLFYVSPTRSLADAEREKRATVARLRACPDRLPDRVLECIARPDIRITVVATGTCGPRKPGGSLRLLAVRRGDTGYLVTQRPGESHWHCAGFAVVEGPALGLAKMVVGALPPVGPGRYTDIMLPDEGLELRAAVRARAERFLRLPTGMTGEITVIQGSSLFGPRGLARRTLRWRDVTGDGRYVIIGNPATVVPADTGGLTAALNNAIAYIVASIREEL